MDRRQFLTAGILLTASCLAGWRRAQAAEQTFQPSPANGWRVFEVSTRVELAPTESATRVWLPLPSVDEPVWIRTMGNLWQGNAASVRIERDPTYGALMLAANWEPGEAAPSLEVISRFATRDRALDFTQTGRPAPLDAATARLYTRSTELLPTDGIVKKTSATITRGAHSDVDKARLIYEWIVENTARNPKTRGCGVGDIRVMLETGNLAGKCADLNALYVGLARAAGRPAARRLWHSCRRLPLWLQESRQEWRHHQGTTLSCRSLAGGLRLGAGRSRRRAQGGTGGKARPVTPGRSGDRHPRETFRRLGNELAGVQRRARSCLAGIHGSEDRLPDVSTGRECGRPFRQSRSGRFPLPDQLSRVGGLNSGRSDARSGRPLEHAITVSSDTPAAQSCLFPTAGCRTRAPDCRPPGCGYRTGFRRAAPPGCR